MKKYYINHLDNTTEEVLFSTIVTMKTILDDYKIPYRKIENEDFAILILL